MNKIKSIIFTTIISILFFGMLYIIPINKKKGKEINALVDTPIISEENITLQDTLTQNVQIEPISTEEIQSIEPPTPKVEPKPTPQTEQPQTNEETEENTTKKENEIKDEVVKEKTPKQKSTKSKEKEKKSDAKKTELAKETEKDKNKEKETPKKSQIGVDRKLVSGIPGTNNYKGKLPKHNVKEKGSITITYVVDANGNVISAQRTGGLRTKNAINNAITMVKKYVKAEKGKSKSTGTYTINF